VRLRVVGFLVALSAIHGLVDAWHGDGSLARSATTWPLLTFGTYLLGAELAPAERRETAGVLAALVGGLLPGVLDHARLPTLDLPIAIAAAGAGWLLLRAVRPGRAFAGAGGSGRRKAAVAGLILVAALVGSYLAAGGGPPGPWAAETGARGRQLVQGAALQTFTPPLFAVTIAAYGWFFGRRRGCDQPHPRAQRDAMFAWWWVVAVAALALATDAPLVAALLPQVGALVGVTLVELPGPAVVRRLVAASVILVGCLGVAGAG